MKPGPAPRCDHDAVVAHYGTSQSLRKTADAFALTHEGVRRIILAKCPANLALWGSRGPGKAGGVMRGLQTQRAIAAAGTRRQ